jgi:hypothetical protein
MSAKTSKRIQLRLRFFKVRGNNKMVFLHRPSNLFGPKATGGRPKSARDQFANKHFASCALEMSSRASGQQVARTTQRVHAKVIVLGEEH